MIRPIYYRLLTEQIILPNIEHARAIMVPNVVDNLKETLPTAVCFDTSNIETAFVEQYVGKNREALFKNLPPCIPPFHTTVYYKNDVHAVLARTNGKEAHFIFIEAPPKAAFCGILPVGIKFEFNSDGTVKEFGTTAQKDLREKGAMADFAAYVMRAMLANALSHCKNTEIKEADLPAGPLRKRLKRARIPRVKYRTVKITNKTEPHQKGGGEKTGIELSQHIRRGNFATYKRPGGFIWGNTNAQSTGPLV